MSAQFARAPHQGRPSGPVQHAPNAALLIDFDNVTLGIRSDLTKDLKNLLNSDIIKGKVAVQRAYADWRRYAQYIVPLSEASVDLIFAPAYGSAKKNATDIRLAIDALELVFTRPEIGTYILLSGDSDFSSLVLKLKEYGKYVIGVGIKESASDLLVQNCDEYYSYSAITGLTRTSEDHAPSDDPWRLAERAIRQMVENGDVMRSDRLKQVMLEIDPNFDEKAIGYNKFSRFVGEAANRGVLRLRKLENGQYEVTLDAAGEPVREERPRERGRDRGRDRQERPAAEPRRESVAEARREPATELRREPAAEAVAPKREPAAEAPAPRREPAPEPAAAAGSIDAAYDLLRRAVAALAEDGAARDSDVKRRMLELQPGWDESALGFSKFSRFLRQAHDAEVIDLRKGDNGNYDVALPGAAPKRREEKPAARAEPRRQEPEAEPAAKPAEAAQPAVESKTPEAPAEAARPRGALLYRGGSRRAGGPSGPPPLLPGQAVAPPGKAAKAEPEPEAAEEKPKRRRGRRGGAKQAAAEATPQAQAAVGPEFAGDLGLPTDEDAVVRYMQNSYKGVGKKTAEALVTAFGAERVFAGLESEPDRVREVLGAGQRTEALLEAWRADYERRRADGAQAPDASAVAEAAEAAAEAAGEEDGLARPKRRRGKRGGRRGKKTTPAGGS